jgi:GT2 family glycosyltransferase
VKLFIGIPSGGAPTKPFLESLATLEFSRDISSADRAVITGNFVPAQRELIARRALEREADRLLMVDDDMVLPPDTLTKLSSVLDADPRCALAGALYYSRDGFRPMAVDRWDANDTTTANVPAFDREPVAVDGVGFGCVLLRLDALQSMKPPYFAAQVYLEPSASRVRVCNEDYLFCARLRSLNYRVVLHAGVRSGHYDRATGVVFPQQWEDASVTNQARMAVMQGGVQCLVPLADVGSAHEAQERVEVTYVWPGA